MTELHRPPSERAFDPVATLYDQFYDTELGRTIDKLEKDLIYSLAEPHPGQLALDVGTGTGHFARDLATRGLRVIGVDVSWAMLSVARNRTRSALPLVHLVHADAARLPFVSDRLDLVLSVTALEFIAAPRLALEEMWRVLRPGGRLVIAVLNAVSPWAEARRQEAAKQETPFSHAHFYAPEEFVALLASFGPVTWNSSVFIGPDGTGLEMAQLLEDTGRALRRDEGALLVGRVDK